MHTMRKHSLFILLCLLISDLRYGHSFSALCTRKNATRDSIFTILNNLGAHNINCPNNNVHYALNLQNMNTEHGYLGICRHVHHIQDPVKNRFEIMYPSTYHLSSGIELNASDIRDFLDETRKVSLLSVEFAGKFVVLRTSKITIPSRLKPKDAISNFFEYPHISVFRAMKPNTNHQTREALQRILPSVKTNQNNDALQYPKSPDIGQILQKFIAYFGVSNTACAAKHKDWKREAVQNVPANQTAYDKMAQFITADSQIHPCITTFKKNDALNTLLVLKIMHRLNAFIHSTKRAKEIELPPSSAKIIQNVHGVAQGVGPCNNTK